MSHLRRLSLCFHSVVLLAATPWVHAKNLFFVWNSRRKIKNKDYASALRYILTAFTLMPEMKFGHKILARSMLGALRAGVSPQGDEILAALSLKVEQKVGELPRISAHALATLNLLKAWQSSDISQLQSFLSAISRKNTFKGRGFIFVSIIFGRIFRRSTNWGNKPIRKWLNRSMAFGVNYGGENPLRQPEVFSAFSKVAQVSGGAIYSFPSELQDLFWKGQLKPSRIHRGSPCKRILVVSDNWNFFELAARSLEQNGFELRFLDFDVIRQSFPKSDRKFSMARLVKSLINRPDPSAVRKALKNRNELASDLIDWADIVFCEWFTDPAVWMSRYLPDEKRLIVRLHSFEAFSDFPFFANIRRIDGLIFIAPHIAAIFSALVGAKVLAGVKVQLISNFRELSRFSYVERSGNARKTLGMTQFASSNKDPCFALDILQCLQATDTGWRLRFVGNGWPPKKPSRKEAIYEDNFKKRLESFGDSVSMDGFTNDMVGWYGQVGYILSTSYREGSHESFVEGMLTGAIPVLRDWPMMSPFGAPASVFPGLDKFSTAAEAAQFILEAEAHFEERSVQAANYCGQLVNSTDPKSELAIFVQSVCGAAEGEERLG